MSSKFPETPRDRDAWARLWGLAREPWDRTEDLSTFLGVARSAVAQWCSGAERGSWPALRTALRETGRRFPEAVPRIIESLASELFDARGTWIPEGSGSGSWHEEGSEAVTAIGDLHRTMRDGNPDQIEEAGHAAMREVHQAVTVAFGVARARRGLVALASTPQPAARRAQ